MQCAALIALHTHRKSVGRLLPRRSSVIVTRQADYAVPSAIVAHTLKDALAACGTDDEVFIIGGGELYREALPLARRIYLTTVDAEPAGDTFMPELDSAQWHEISAQAYPPDDRHAHGYRFAVLERK